MQDISVICGHFYVRYNDVVDIIRWMHTPHNIMRLSLFRHMTSGYFNNSYGVNSLQITIYMKGCGKLCLQNTRQRLFDSDHYIQLRTWKNSLSWHNLINHSFNNDAIIWITGFIIHYAELSIIASPCLWQLLDIPFMNAILDIGVITESLYSNKWFSRLNEWLLSTLFISHEYMQLTFADPSYVIHKFFINAA